VPKTGGAPASGSLPLVYMMIAGGLLAAIGAGLAFRSRLVR